MLPMWAETYSDAYDEDVLLCSIQEEFSVLNSMNNDNIGYKVVAQIRKLTSFLERGVIKGVICFLTSTGTVLGAIEQVSKKAERSINETVDQLSGTDRDACKDELFPPFCLDDNTDESSRPDEGTRKAEEVGFNNGHISNDLTSPLSHLSPTTAVTGELKQKTREDVTFDESNC